MSNYPQSKVIRRFFMKGQPLAYGKHEVILGNEPTPNGVYYINSGYIKAYSISDEGDEFLHLIYGQGELFPLIWAYTDFQPKNVYYETLSDCVVWRIAKEWFSAFITSNIEASQDMSVQLARQFQFFADRLDNLEYKKASERVIYRLLYLAMRFGVSEGAGTRIDAPITHECIASSINLVRESVSREFEKLELEDIISQKDHQIIIKDMERLKNRLNLAAGLQYSHESSQSTIYKAVRSSPKSVIESI